MGYEGGSVTRRWGATACSRTRGRAERAACEGRGTPSDRCLSGSGTLVSTAATHWPAYGTASRNVEPESTLLRELYSLTTSPSGRARPLGEVVREYNSLKRVDSGSTFREAVPYAGQCVAAVLTKVPLPDRHRSLGVPRPSHAARSARPRVREHAVAPHRRVTDPPS